MHLYLLRKKELRTMVLPQKVSGQHSLMYTSDSGELRPLIRINAREDKWFISENKQVQISGGISIGTSEFKELELKENQLYYLRRDNRENIVLMVEPDHEDRCYYMHYKVPEGGIIDVGQADYNQICYEHPFINPHKHLRIQYHSGGKITVQDCETEVPEQKRNYAYLNQEIVYSNRDAKIGDTVFLFGVKIVLGADFIAINNPAHQVRVRLESRNFILFHPKELEEEEVSDEKTSFSSAPRARREVIHREFKVEKPPEDIADSDTPWIVMMGPSITMAIGSLFSSVMTINNIMSSSGSISNALPSLVTSVVMVLGSAVWPTIGRRVQRRSQVRKAVISSQDYETYLKQLRREIEEAIRQQKEILTENNPLLEECIKNIETAGEHLWERSQRHKDFLEVMIGHGDLPLEAKFSYPERGYQSEIGQPAREMYRLVAGEHIVKDAPITIPLKGAGIVGVIGDRSNVVSFGKALLLMLTSMHNYEDLKIIFIYNEKEKKEWNFVKWIPHVWNNERSVRYIANDADEVRILSDYIGNLRSVQAHSSHKDTKGPYYIIFAADKTLAERAQAIKELYQSPDSENMTVIAMYDERQYLPKACSYVIDLIRDEDRARDPDKLENIAATLADYNDITGQRIYCHEHIRYEGNPEKIFIQMLNIHLDTPETKKRLPNQFTFMEMFEVGKPEHLDLARRWRDNNTVNSLAAPIGVDADGYYINLDIHEKAHGPHGVIAGMTGSGKSEFIVSYIASLAINYSPDDVAFVLIDFKGGGMADIFKDLPHTAGLITNLDGNELKRSFLAIEHELEKRQKLFKEISDQKKISNIDICKYQKLRLEDPSLKPLPHLVLISDEFAELKQQHSDFMGQLIRIARIGRSLGVHLILATQKPDGVVDEQIKSNIRFKVCLKVQDKSDSQSMIGRPDATLITNPGRFYFQVGNDEVFEYGQSPWSGASYEPMDHARKNVCDYIEVLNEQGMVICRQSPPKGKREEGVPEKQIDALVQFLRQTADENGLRAEKLWLNPLPAPKAEKKKETIYDTTIRPFVLNPQIGMYDDLMNQKHLPLTIPFTDEGHALLYGTAGSGKLEFLNSMLVSLLKHHTAEELQLYICDHDSGSLAAFEDAPHTKYMNGIGDRSGCERILDELIYQLSERREIFRKYGGDYQAYIRSSGKTLPNLLLIVHNYQNFADCYMDARPKIIQIAREGMKYGIFVILVGTTSNSIPYAMQPLFKNIYTLRQNSEDQYRDIVGKTEGISPDNFRGRGLVRVDNVVCEFQTGIVYEDAKNTYEAIQRFCNGLGVGRKKENQNQEAELEAVREEPSKWTVNQFPLGYDHSGKLMRVDLASSAKTLIVYDNSHKNEAEAVRRGLCQTGIKQVVLHEHCEGLSDQIDALWEEMLSRGKEGSEAKAAGKPIPAFAPLIIRVEQPSIITDIVPEKQRVKLCSMIQALSPAYCMYFVIFTAVEHTADVLGGKCMGSSLPFQQGCVLTMDATAHTLFDETVSFANSARSPKGYFIQKGNAEMIEFVTM